MRLGHIVGAGAMIDQSQLPRMSIISSVLLIQKGLLALTLLLALIFLGVLARRLVLVQEEKPRSSLLMDLLANMSDSLDRIEAGLDDITARASAAKTRLIKLNAMKSQLKPCELIRNLDRVKKTKIKLPIR